MEEAVPGVQIYVPPASWRPDPVASVVGDGGEGGVDGVGGRKAGGGAASAAFAFDPRPRRCRLPLRPAHAGAALLRPRAACTLLVPPPPPARTPAQRRRVEGREREEDKIVMSREGRGG
ncbi:hypothetical protein OsI_15121 [Oryza sativa Indica Group]|uniref:Uncharacterized protein n=1 Tax=Oryza sativa subsp. indica TaxID=39946 RepID=B8ARJ6_ORYSI|nr:hypothetical protein OsI_15121 [Oryza sativa Indica Group]